MHTATTRRPARTTSGRSISSRLHERRAYTRGRRELELALSGHYGRGVQADVVAAQGRQT